MKGIITIAAAAGIIAHYNNNAYAIDRKMILSKISGVKDHKQLVLVLGDSMNSFKTDIYTFEKKEDRWSEVFPAIRGVAGLKGFSEDKREGDHKTPVGLYGFDFMFGKKINPGVKYRYVKTSKQDYWIDDSDSEDYNTLQHTADDPHKKWKSFERMLREDTRYDYGAVISYNTDERVPGLGSAIFMHIYKNANTGTEGCVAMSQRELLNVLKWLDPEKKPAILIIPKEEFKNIEIGE